MAVIVVLIYRNTYSARSGIFGGKIYVLARNTLNS
jgi:hypothetical protein